MPRARQPTDETDRIGSGRGAPDSRWRRPVCQQAVAHKTLLHQPSWLWLLASPASSPPCRRAGAAAPACTSDAPRMTWKFVTMWPDMSHTKPLPWPAGQEGGGGGGALSKRGGHNVTLRPARLGWWLAGASRASHIAQPVHVCRRAGSSPTPADPNRVAPPVTHPAESSGHRWSSSGGPWRYWRC